MTRDTAPSWLTTAALVTLAIALHGYHFGIEDQTLYVPAIAHAVDSTLFPHDVAFFATETRFTLFDELMATAARASNLPLDVLAFATYLVTVGAVVRACQRLAFACFGAAPAAIAGTTAVVMLLPFPVAGTRVGLLEWYLHPRGPAVALILWAAVAAIDRRMIAVPLATIAAAIHPLTALWAALHVVLQGWPWQPSRWPWGLSALLILAATAMSCAPPARPPDWETTYWRHALTPQFFGVRYPLNWPWYEWVGVVAPLAILGAIAAYARHRQAPILQRVSTRMALSGSVGAVIAVALTTFPSRQLPLQPMRELHLVYFVTFLLAGGALEQWWIRGRWTMRIACAVLLIGGVLVGQPKFAHSRHVEWPGAEPSNAWARAFVWAKANTPRDALFALDPFYLRREGPDTHSFRALAERSMLAEAVHDLAPAAMSPELGARWVAESKALAGWRTFTAADFQSLQQQFGVTWVVVAQPRVEGLDCPFENEAAAVCELATSRERPRQK